MSCESKTAAVCDSGYIGKQLSVPNTKRWQSHSECVVATCRRASMARTTSGEFHSGEKEDACGMRWQWGLVRSQEVGGMFAWFLAWIKRRAVGVCVVELLPLVILPLRLILLLALSCSIHARQMSS